MAQTAANIHVGAGRIWLGTTAPATGTPPTWLTHTDGALATGTEVGHTEGESTFQYQLTKEELKSEQALASVDVYPTEEMCSLVFTAQERVLQTLRAAFDNIGDVDDATRTGFYGGGGTSILAPRTQTVVLTSRRRDATTKFEVLMIYKAFSVEALQLTYSRATPSRYAITLRGIADSSRNDGDRLFQWSREK